MSEIICTHRWMSILRGERDEPFVAVSPGVMVIALNTAREVLFLVEPTIPDGAWVLSLPGGALDDSEDPAVCANRELQEEAGFLAQRLDRLGQIDLDRRHLIWSLHLYLGRDLIESHLEGDEPYPIEQRWMPLDRFESWIDSGEISDAPMISALYLARRFLDAEAGRQTKEVTNEV